jgi:hypothetical protein
MFIDAFDPEDILLQTEIGSDAESALDTLYVTVLQSAGKWKDKIDRTRNG